MSVGAGRGAKACMDQPQALVHVALSAMGLDGNACLDPAPPPPGGITQRPAAPRFRLCACSRQTIRAST